MYKGYFVTVLREIPFGLVQYPLYEYFKKKNKKKNDFHYAFCGAKAGGIAAVLTTPIDVLKTKIMTDIDSKMNISSVVKLCTKINSEDGIKGFFKGVHLRFLYISIGGMIFFGTNEKMKSLLNFIPNN